jgi:hypothetical protein
VTHVIVILGGGQAGLAAADANVVALRIMGPLDNRLDFHEAHRCAAVPQFAEHELGT